jgi:transketolase
MGKINGTLSFPAQTKGGTRDGYGEALLELGEGDKNIVALSADLAESTRVHLFAKKFPERFFQVGVAEQNMAAVSAGLAYAGKTAFASSFGVFSPGRNWDFIRTAICYANADVKIASTHTGLTVGEDGATHQALEDIAITRVLPNMKVVVPCDCLEAKKATFVIAREKGPFYLRLGREKLPIATTEQTPFSIGKIETFRDGSDIAIVACGSLVYESLLAAEELAKEGIDARVLNCHTIKPLDSKAIEAAARDCGLIVTAEEHQIIGGLGGAVAEVLGETCPVPMARVGMRDSFGESGTGLELLNKYKLNKAGVIEAAKSLISRKPAGAC